jgi:hypothetical protein
VNGKGKKSTFVCKNILDIDDHNARYLLVNRYTKKQILLEVKKDLINNINIYFYSLNEKLDYDSNFLSLVGTSPIGYINKKTDSENPTVYDKIHFDHEEFEVIKYLVSPDELPANPAQAGYYQDGNNNWYFLSKRSKGKVLECDVKHKRVSWEYKQGDEKLLIEVAAYDNIIQYNINKPSIYIYSGKKIHRKDIQLSHIYFQEKIGGVLESV